MSHLSRPPPTPPVWLATRSLVGADPSALVLIEHQTVSATHALIRWRAADGWTVRDLGSTNGTWRNGKVVRPDAEIPLADGDLLRFGDAEAGEWRCVLGPAPRPFATRLLDRLQVPAVDGCLELPQTGTLVVLDGEALTWRLHTAAGARPVHDGELVDDGGVWRLHLPDHRATVGRASLARLADATLRFEVSSDLENVRLRVDLHGQTLDLENRKHWYSLWVLAGVRWEEEARGVAEPGWIDTATLARRVGDSARTVDVHYTRARADLAAAGFIDAHTLIEARPNQRRLGVRAVASRAGSADPS